MAQREEMAGRSDPPFAGAWPAVIVISLTLLAVSAAKYPGFARPHYVSALALQAGALLLLLIEAFPWRNRPLPYKGASAAGLFAIYGYCCVMMSWYIWYWAPERSRYLCVIGSVTAVQGVVWALLVSRLVRDARSLNWVLRAVAAAGAVAALAGIFYVVTYHTPGRLPFWMRIFGERWETLRGEFSAALDRIEQVQGHRNFLAIFLLPPLLLCLAELFAKRLTRGAAYRGFLGFPAWLVISLITPMIVALAFCKSWGSLIGAAAGAVCLAAMRLSRRWRLVLLGAALVFGITVVVALSSSAVQERMVSKSQGTRLFMWKGTLRMIQERPLLGWGTGMFMPFFPDYKPTEPMRYGWLTSQTIYPHDEPLLVGVEVGLLGLALYLAAHLLAAGRFMQREAAAQDPALRLAGWAVLAGALAMFLHGLVEVSLRFWAPATMYWTMAGLLMALPCIIRRPESPRRRPSRILGAVGFCLAGVVALMLGRWLVLDGARSEWLMGAGSRDLTVERYAESHMKAAQVSRYVPDVLEALGRRARALSRADRLPEAIEAYKGVYSISPGFLTRDGSARYMLAALHFREAQRSGSADTAVAVKALAIAQQFCEEAIAQNPYDAFSRTLMAGILLEGPDRNMPEAIKHLQQGAAAPNATGWTHYRLATLLAAAGRPNDALAALERAEGMVKKDEPLAKDIESLRKRLTNQ